MDLGKVVTGEELAVFSNLLRPTSRDDIRLLRGRVVLHLDALEEQSFSFETLDIDLARRLSGGLCQLIDGAASFDAEERSLLRGAVEYFLLSSDADHDVTSPVGLLDDNRVFNSACRALGRADLEIPISV
jgi:hypothetical protein